MMRKVRRASANVYHEAKGLPETSSELLVTKRQRSAYIHGFSAQQSLPEAAVLVSTIAD
jgi:hypothetical protein